MQRYIKISLYRKIYGDKFLLYLDFVFFKLDSQLLKGRKILHDLGLIFSRKGWKSVEKGFFWCKFGLFFGVLGLFCFGVGFPLGGLLSDYSSFVSRFFRFVVLSVPVIGTTSTGYWYYQYRLLVLPVPVSDTASTSYWYYQYRLLVLPVSIRKKNLILSFGKFFLCLVVFNLECATYTQRRHNRQLFYSFGCYTV